MAELQVDAVHADAIEKFGSFHLSVDVVVDIPCINELSAKRRQRFDRDSSGKFFPGRFPCVVILKNQEGIRVLCFKGSYEAFPFLTAFFFIHIKQQLSVAGSGLVLQCHSLQKNQPCAALCVAVVPHLHILRKVTALRGVCTFHRQYGKSVFRCQPANLQRTP